MTRLLLALLILFAPLIAITPASAQQTNAIVVATCGTPPSGYTAGATRPVTQDTDGKLCSGAAISGGSVSLSGPVNLAAATTGGCTLSGTQSAASTNSTNIKAAAGTLCGGTVINTTATLYYLRLYNLSSAPTCSSATGFVATYPIPASATGNGTLIGLGTFGADFSTGIGFCLTGGGTSTDNTNAATGVYINLAYK